MNGENNNSNSSSKKRSKQLIQCRACNCFMLAKNIDKHQILNEFSATDLTESSSTIQLETPKIVKQKRFTNARNNKRPSSTGSSSYNCNNSGGFISSQIELIEPSIGMVLRTLNNIKEEWDKFFPIEMYGWQRKNSALVNPEVLATLNAPSRSAFIIIPENDTTLLETEILILWPCEEIPLMHIAFPPLPYYEKLEIPDSLLVRLQLLHSFGQPLTKILLKPNLSIKNGINLQEWSKIEKLDYFPYFIKCYFGNALFPISSKLIEILYYGRKLNFKIISIEEENKEYQMEGIETKMQSCKIDEVIEVNNKSSLYYPTTIHRVSNSCIYKIDWSEVLQLVADKKENNNDTEDPDCLL